MAAAPDSAAARTGRNPASDAVAGEVVPEGAPDVPTVVEPFADPDAAGPGEDLEPDQERQAAVDEAKAEWKAAEEDAKRRGAPPPAEEVVEQYVEE